MVSTFKFSQHPSEAGPCASCHQNVQLWHQSIILQLFADACKQLDSVSKHTPYACVLILGKFESRGKNGPSKMASKKFYCSNCTTTQFSHHNTHRSYDDPASLVAHSTHKIEVEPIQALVLLDCHQLYGGTWTWQCLSLQYWCRVKFHSEDRAVQLAQLGTLESDALEAV